MIALNGVRLHKLSRDGQVARRLRHARLRHAPGAVEDVLRPVRPGDLPDGTKVAYTYYYMTQSQNPGCFPPDLRRRRSTRPAPATRTPTARPSWDEPGLGYHSGWRHPSWVDNDMTMISNPSHLPNRDIILDRISDGGNGHGNMVMNWTATWSTRTRTSSGGDITRDKRKLAFQSGENDSTLTVSYVPAFPTAWKDGDPNTDEIHVCYRYSEPGGRRASACRRSRRTAARSPTTTVTASTSRPSRPSAATARSTARPPTPPVVIPGGVEPDWGPADVPPPRTRRARHERPTPRRPRRSSLSVKVAQRVQARGREALA